MDTWKQQVAFVCDDLAKYGLLVSQDAQEVLAALIRSIERDPVSRQVNPRLQQERLIRGLPSFLLELPRRKPSLIEPCDLLPRAMVMEVFKCVET